jgi:O-acetyl-ADP-ribose deacetylase (regulator of RNase III)
MKISVVRGNIVHQPVDAVVTAGNTSLRGGSGVNGAVHAAAGPRLLAASRPLAPCPAGSAVVTPAFDLTPARWVIHAVGPRYRGPADARVLAAAYTAALARADEVGARSVAFPSISTGVYGYPEEDAAEVSVAALLSATTQVESVLLVAFSSRAAALWTAALERFDRSHPGNTASPQDGH